MASGGPAADIPGTNPPSLEKPEPLPEDVPLRLVQMALAHSRSTYFSNFEVFLAERRIRKGESEYIKLVYTFLPYQRRLSEYGLKTSKTFKLRVVRDTTCDESLLQMTWGEPGQTAPNPQDVLDAPTNVEDEGKPLPCYRTTADDYRRAILGAR
jgi:hypothetical protein